MVFLTAVILLYEVRDAQSKTSESPFQPIIRITDTTSNSRLFTVPYFFVRSSRPKTLRYGRQSWFHMCRTLTLDGLPQGKVFNLDGLTEKY